MPQRLLLIGGGHSHIEVLRRLGLDPEPGAVVTLVSPERHAAYSGMLPGLIAGHYRHADCHIDLDALCRRAGSARVETAVTALDPEQGRVHCSDGSSLDYDLVSIDTGSTPALAGIPGATQHGTPVKPVAPFLAAWSAFREAAAAGAPRMVVVGAGSGGIEVALAMAYRLRTDGSRAQVTVVGDGPVVLPGHGAAVQRRFAALLAAQGVTVAGSGPVLQAGPGGLLLRDGSRCPADAIVWVTGAAAPGWVPASGLATDAAGFIRINGHLQSVSHPRVFAAGDIAGLQHAPRPKSGVYAVRQGPPLAANLRRALRQDPLLTYRPQARALALISAGDRYAVASYGPLALAGHWVWHWKDRIDTRFMRRYGAPP